MSAITVTRGDMYWHISAGGGGFGTPLDRDPASCWSTCSTGRSASPPLETVRRRRRSTRRPSMRPARRSCGPRCARRAAEPDSRDRDGLVIRHGSVLDGTGLRPGAPTSRSRTAGSTQIGEVPARRGRTRRRRPGRAGVHRHPQPLGLHASRRSARGQRRPSGRDTRGDRQLRTRLLPDPRREPRGAGDLRPLRRGARSPGSTAAGYFERLEEARPAVNVLSLVPNGQLRLAAVGLEDRPATPTSWRRCSGSSSEALDEGAWGYSSGLEYAQERGATEEELRASAA